MTIDVLTLGFWMRGELQAELGDHFLLHDHWQADSPLPEDIAGRIRVAITYTGAPSIERPLLERLPALELIVVMGAGVDCVDLAAAQARGVEVRNCPGANAVDVAELAIGLMIAVERRIVSEDADARTGQWTRRRGRRLAGLRLGILGMGHIGMAIASRAAAFEMEIFHASRRERPDLPYRQLPDTVALARAVDIVVLALPADDSTRHIVNAEVLDALGPDGVLINVARGALVDEAALIAALADRRLRGAGLDVSEEEPGFPEALLTMRNVVLSPHNGGNTEEAFQAVRAAAVAHVRAWFPETVETTDLIRTE